MLTNEQIEEIYKRWNASQKGEWKAYIEGRDHTSGSSFIMTGIGEERGEDIEMYGATSADYDFIANAKQDVPRLIEEVKRLKKIIENQH